MKLIIARHAQTDENVKKIDIGHNSKAKLNKEGILQAKKLARHLKGEKIAIAYVSPQERAVHTAKEVLKFHPLVKMIHAPHLREQNLGIYESLPRHEYKTIKEKSAEPFELFKPPQGESYVQLQERVKIFFDYLAQHHKNDTVFVVSHGGTLGMLYIHLFNKPITKENYQAHKPENAELSIIEIYKSQPIFRTINSKAHLHEKA